MAYRGSTEGVMAVVREKSRSLEDLQLGAAPLIMVLERVEKPGNLGAVLRSADAAKADAVICHGGLSTVRESFLAGVPMIICPRAFDQAGNAKRVEELGAGITLDNNRPETLRRAVRLMLSVPSYRENSFRIGQTLRNSGTVEEAARWTLSCVRQNKREVT
jgi:UDP:flavonoid glycosyltransferase YjiC (YdhE family)